MKFETLKNYKKNNLFEKLSKSHQFFEFDFDKFNVCDVCDEVLDCFEGCIKFQYEDIKRLNEYKGLKDFLKDNEVIYEECIDIIGLYKECDKNIVIFLAKNKIKNLAEKYNVSFENFYNFIKVHELAHGFMSPFVNNYKKVSYNSIEDIVIEESLATAFALKVMKSSKQFSKIQKFVEKQPIQYKFGLKVFEVFENSIELLMILWKMSKITGDKKTIYQILLNFEWDNQVECKEFVKMLFNDEDEKSMIIISLIFKEIFNNQIFQELIGIVRENFKTVLVLNKERAKWIDDNCFKYKYCIYFFAVNFMKNVKNIESFSYIPYYSISKIKCNSIRKLFKMRLLKTEKKIGEEVLVESPFEVFEIRFESDYDDCHCNNIWFKIVEKNELLYPWRVRL